MKPVPIVVCAVLTLALAVPSATMARGGRSPKVVCISQKHEKRVYRKKPDRCTFHRRGAPMAEAFFVRTKHDHWRTWRRSHARGKGKDVAPMGNATAHVRIRLKDPVRKCGHRVFSKAHFFFPRVQRGSTMKLDLCA